MKIRRKKIENASQEEKLEKKAQNRIKKNNLGTYILINEYGHDLDGKAQNRNKKMGTHMLTN